MHKKKINNSLTKNFIQGLRPLSNTLPTQIKKVFSNKIFGILNLPLGGENRSSRIYDLKTNAYVR